MKTKFFEYKLMISIVKKKNELKTITNISTSINVNMIYSLFWKGFITIYLIIILSVVLQTPYDGHVSTAVD